MIYNVAVYSKLINLYTHTYIYIYFRFFFIIGYYKIVNIVSYAVELVLIYLVYIYVCDKSLSCVQFFATPWTIACQAPLPRAISQARIL